MIPLDFLSLGFGVKDTYETVWLSGDLLFYISICLGLVALYGLAFNRQYLFKEFWIAFFLYVLGYELMYSNYVLYSETIKEFGEFDSWSYIILSIYLMFMCIYIFGIYRYLCQIPHLRSKYLV